MISYISYIQDHNKIVIQQILKFNMRLLIVCIIILMLNPSSCQQEIGKAEQSHYISLQGQILSAQAQQIQDRQQQIPSFIAQEIKQAQLHQQTFKEAQSFLLSLESGEDHQFRYRIQSNTNPNIILRIYTGLDGVGISVIKDHQAGRYLEVYSSIDLLSTEQLVGKAYVHKFISLQQHIQPYLFIRLRNKFEQQIIVEVSLSGAPQKINQLNILKNIQLESAAKKLESLQGQMREGKGKGRKVFKFQWGFLEREQHYEQQMLKLTGFQAFIILATAVVQIYCIKNLIEERAVIV